MTFLLHVLSAVALVAASLLAVLALGFLLAVARAVGALISDRDKDKD